MWRPYESRGQRSTQIWSMPTRTSFLAGSPMRASFMPVSFSDRRMLTALAICASMACGSAPSSKQAQHTQVRLAVTIGSFFFLPVFVAGPAGCFKKHGLTVTIEETEGASKSLQALLGGSVDVAACGYLQTLDLVAQGRPLRAFLVMQRLPGFAVIVSPRASRPIHTIADLKGMRVGISTPGIDGPRVLNEILRRHGMQPEDVRFITLGAPVNQIPSVERGLVDVNLSSAMTISVLQRHPNLDILIDTRTPELTKEALGVAEVPVRFGKCRLLGAAILRRVYSGAVRRRGGAACLRRRPAVGHSTTSHASRRGAAQLRNRSGRRRAASCRRRLWALYNRDACRRESNLGPDGGRSSVGGRRGSVAWHRGQRTKRSIATDSSATAAGLRHRGTEACLTIDQPADGDFSAAFQQEHQRLYGYIHADRPLEIVAARIEAVGRWAAALPEARHVGARPLPAARHSTVRFDGQPLDADLPSRRASAGADGFAGPAIVHEFASTTVVDPGWEAEVLSGGEILLTDTAAEVAGTLRVPFAGADDNVSDEATASRRTAHGVCLRH